MLKNRRLMMALGAAVGGLAATAFLQVPLANAIPGGDACSLGECQLLSGGPESPENYYGFRPLFEQWVGDQPINVTVGTGANSTIEGSYNVAENDISTPYLDEATYQFGNFTADAANNPTGTDGDLAGATVYDMVLGPGGKTVDGATTFEIQDFNVFLANGDHVWIIDDPGVFSEYISSTPTDSGVWYTLGDSTTPTLLYDTLTNPSFPTEVFTEGNYLPYDYWLPVFDSMFPPGLT
jgi:hypothetical protein